MTEFFKLTFDLTLYWTISGCFLILTTSASPSIAAFLLLTASVLADVFLRERDLRRGALKYLPLVLPLFAAFAKPSLPQVIQAAPVCGFLVYSMLSDRIETHYEGFRAHFGFCLKLLLLFILAPFIRKNFSDALIRSVPFLVAMLAIGVCALRMLREQKQSGLRQAVYLCVFILFCAALTVGRAPQLLLKGFGLLYKYLIGPLIFVFALVVSVVFYVFYLLLGWLVSRAKGNREPLRIELEGPAEMLGLDDKIQTYTADLRWLKYLLIVLGVAALGFLVFLVFRRMLGDRGSGEAPVRLKDRTFRADESLSPPKLPRRFPPRAPRLAIRFYFARFLSECKKRGVPVSKGTTSVELAKKAAAFFPGEDPAPLAALYAPARYSSDAHFTRADAQTAAELWHSLKRCPPPDAIGKKKKQKNSP